MPKLPKGLYVRRGNQFFTRKFYNGKDHMICLGKDREEAVRRLREMRRTNRLPVRLLVREAAETWLESYCRTARNPKNLRVARQRVRDYLNEFMGHMLIEKLEPDTLRQYRIWLEKRGLSLQTVGHILSDARCLLRWLVDCGKLERSPFPSRLMPRLKERPVNRLSEPDAERVASLPEPHGFVCRVALGTGLRWTELAGLQASDLQGGTLVVGNTKSGKVRRVPIPGALQAEIRNRVGRLVPFGQSGTFNRTVRRKSGVEDFHIHRLRHTFACRWIDAGGSIVALQEVLGHSTLQMTQRYARASETFVQAEAAKVHANL